MPPTLCMTRYSPHYLMFRQRPRLPVNFYFPTFRSAEAPTREASAKCVDEYIATVWDRLRPALQEVQAPLTAEAHQQKWYYHWKIGTMNLKPGDLVLVKADAFKGKRKIRDRWEEEIWGGMSDHDRHPLLWSDRPMQTVTHPLKPTSSHCIRCWHSPVYRCPSCMGQMYQLPPHTRPLQMEVKIWWCHKRAVVGQLPNAQPARLP